MNPGLIKEKMENYNSDYSHPSYFLEVKILSEIRQGLLNEAIASLDLLNAREKSNLAYNTIRSLKNSLIASCTLFTRAAINGGVAPEDAFSMSDSFIKQIEMLNKDTDLIALEYTMVREYIGLIKQSSVKKYIRSVSKVIGYINENITSKMNVAMLAKVAHLSPDHLSKVFYNEVGMHLTDYIQQRKIEVAKIFLEHSNMRIADIAAMLEFCSTAYFSSVFNKHTGISAAQYRKQIQ